VGNPHCVVFADDPSVGALERLGPELSTHPAFAHGTNVQLARVVSGRRPRLPGFGSGERAEIPVVSGGVGGPTWPTIPRPGASDDGGGVVDARIWERGVGPTAASGTSACAVAVAVVRAGLLEPGRVEVRTEGGSLFVDVGPGLEVALRGPVAEVMTGELSRGFLEDLAGVSGG
jgi:diaminopimelate epimerase